VYVDVLESSRNLDLKGLDALVSTATAAVVVTHLYGRMADVEAIAAWCDAHGIPLVEDCAQAHGASRGARRAGSFGRVGCFSFYPTKNLGALGDGGVVVTRDEALADRLRALRQYGWHAKYEARIGGGVNSRLDEIQAAVLDHRLASLDARNGRRQDVARRYGERIRHPAIVLPPILGEDDVAHLYVIQTRHRASLQRHLDALGIATDVHYPIPDHLQAAYALSPRPRLTVTERLADEVLTLPCFPELTDAEVDAVIGACNAWPTDA
jgi:dTDP-3-amino-2,3,6-trideoxy-4-keto-D-glucose/dTDP-3-amino-3,4,6-trideoxy-alpha-D-glucose/dTDP-2,6-dideoxy-D-kanosamine transaminase